MISNDYNETKVLLGSLISSKVQYQSKVKELRKVQELKLKFRFELKIQ